MNTRRRMSRLIAVSCIACGTAAVIAMLSLIEASLWRPLPFPESRRLVRIWLAEDQGAPRVDLSLPEVADLQRSLQTVDRFAGIARSRLVARLPGGTERLRGEAVESGYFELIGQHAALGRLFNADDHQAGSEPAVVLSHGIWQGRYGGDPAVLGQTLDAAGRSFRIVGVMPSGFAGTIESDLIDVWLPQAHYEPAALRQDRSARMGWTIARLAPDTSIAALRDELDAVFSGWVETYPDLYANRHLRVEPLGENWRGAMRENAGLLLMAVLVLLAIAIANVGALLLMRALDRQREFALRCAIGASRGRIARLLLIEAGLLALGGGVIGALIAPWVLRGLVALAPLQLPPYVSLQASPQSMLLVIASLIVTAALAASLPTWLGSRVAPRAVLVAGDRHSAGSGERRAWTMIIGAELALSFALLVTGGLLVRSYVALAQVDLGFRSQDVVRLAITFAPADFGDVGQLPQRYQAARQALQTVPGVLSAGLVAPTLPPWDANRPTLQHAALREAAPDGISVGAHAIDTGLLTTLDIDLLAGRLIDDGDDAQRPAVALVSADLAGRLGGMARAIGSEIALDSGREGQAPRTYRVVGVVENVSWDGRSEQDTGRYIRYGDASDARGSRNDVYLALAQHPTPVVSLAVHTVMPAESQVEPLRRALSATAPASAVHWVSTMEDELAGEVAASRFYLTVVVAFGSSALLLAAVGLFAVSSTAWMKRQRELGIRLALGADARQIARLILLDGVRLLAIGLGAGLLLAFAAARGFEHAWYQVDAHDPVAFLASMGLLALVVALAMLAPLRRALDTPPTEALRDG